VTGRCQLGRYADNFLLLAPHVFFIRAVMKSVFHDFKYTHVNSGHVSVVLLAPLLVDIPLTGVLHATAVNLTATFVYLASAALSRI
jgi:hypothetical protein